MKFYTEFECFFPYNEEKILGWANVWGEVVSEYPKIIKVEAVIDSNKLNKDVEKHVKIWLGSKWFSTIVLADLVAFLSGGNKTFFKPLKK